MASEDGGDSKTVRSQSGQFFISRPVGEPGPVDDGVPRSAADRTGGAELWTLRITGDA
jgi:hypothetical protein